MKRARMFAIVGVAVGLVVVVGLFLAYRGLTHLVEGEIRSALGQGATIRSLEVNWNGIGVTELRVPAPQGALSPQMLKAERIWVTPSLRSLFTRALSIASVEIDQAYLLIRRTPSGMVLPLPTRASSPASTGRAIEIRRVDIPNASIDWDDTTVTPPVRLRLAPVRITLTAIHLPASGPVNLTVEGQVAGRPPGWLTMTGWFHPQSRDSDLRVRVAGVDLVPLQPYFLGPRDSRLTSGSFDLTMESRVKAQKLHAPGQLTLIDLRFVPGIGFLQTFVGLPRDAVLRFLETNRRLEVEFVVEGPIDAPEFRLQEAMSRKIALALAEKLGVPLQGIGKEVIGIGATGAEAVKKEGEAFGKVLREIFK